MKKVIEFNPKYNLGDTVYGIFNNKVVKAKIISINYSKKSTLVSEDFANRISYEAAPLDNSFNTYYINVDNEHSMEGVWFKSKDDIIDYLKTQIDKIAKV